MIEFSYSLEKTFILSLLRAIIFGHAKAFFPREFSSSLNGQDGGLSCFNISFLASGFLTWNFVMEFWLSNFFLFTVWIQTIRIIARFVIAIERRENSNSYSRYALISRF